MSTTVICILVIWIGLNLLFVLNRVAIGEHREQRRMTRVPARFGTAESVNEAAIQSPMRVLAAALLFAHGFLSTMLGSTD